MRCIYIYILDADGNDGKSGQGNAESLNTDRSHSHNMISFSIMSSRVATWCNKSPSCLLSAESLKHSFKRRHPLAIVSLKKERSDIFSSIVEQIL